VVAVVVALAAGCARGPAGLTHQVRPGETLYRIGQAYGVPYADLARVNGINDPNRIEVGTRITIPNATRELPVNVITPETARGDRPAPRDLPKGRTPFQWPISGAVMSGFGPRGDTHHDGIDIPCSAGAPVRAARNGRVLYSDTLRGYGRLVIVEHDQGYATVYAHNQDNLVQTGAVVVQGQVIAYCGESGQADGANLHFELRQDNVARNPLFYLPPQGRVTAARATTSVVERTP
jgi:murein DD-endopeptidase MepM/ murein hydrolase activator NlpD